MKVIEQNGNEYQTHEIMFTGKVVKCVPDSDRRKSGELGRYESMERAAEVLVQIYSASSNGKDEYVVPEN